MKRLFDFSLSTIGLMLASPILLYAIVMVWLYDRKNPFYIADRVGKNGKLFRMVKLRSMSVGADKSGVDSTAADDARITPIGQFIRKYKLDELTQLWNVFIGDMSLVGPRPNVKRETDLYTEEEKRLLTIRPGITDFASIVFSDEGDILAGKTDPDLAYNQLIRPLKSRLGIIYIQNLSIIIDIKLILLTAIAIISRSKALTKTGVLLKKLNTPTDIIEAASRSSKLEPSAPPGSSKIILSRN